MASSELTITINVPGLSEVELSNVGAAFHGFVRVARFVVEREADEVTLGLYKGMAEFLDVIILEMASRVVEFKEVAAVETIADLGWGPDDGE